MKYLIATLYILIGFSCGVPTSEYEQMEYKVDSLILELETVKMELEEMKTGPERLLNEAKELVIEGKTESAIKTLQILLEKHPATDQANEGGLMLTELNAQLNQNKAKEVKELEMAESEFNQKVLVEFKALYKELKGFKNSESFAKYGFGEGGPHKEWLQKAKRLADDPHNSFLLERKVVAGDLVQLGMSYASNGGKEDDVTRFLDGAISKAVKK